MFGFVPTFLVKDDGFWVWSSANNCKFLSFVALAYKPEDSSRNPVSRPFWWYQFYFCGCKCECTASATSAVVVRNKLQKLLRHSKFTTAWREGLRFLHTNKAHTYSVYIKRKPVQLFIFWYQHHLWYMQMSFRKIENYSHTSYVSTSKVYNVNRRRVYVYLLPVQLLLKQRVPY